ncbi:MAG TPA: sulfotransferase domain-containing protein [Myxococcota bacterium]
MSREPVDRWSLRPFDAAFVSFPKCGRTWVRLMLGRLVALQHGGAEKADDLDALFDVYEATRGLRDTPTVVFTHDDWPQHHRADELTRDKAPLYRDKIVVLLVRDLRDVMVSSFFQLTRREQKRHDPSLSAYLRSEVGGADSFTAFYNNWWANRGVPKQLHVVRYEDLHADPLATLRAILDGIAWPPVSPELLGDVAAWSAFENLRSKSLRSERRELQPRRAEDPESFKMRRGRVGGFREYLSADDVAFLNERMRRLDAGYGYGACIEDR